MAPHKVVRESPWCMVALVACTLLSHTLVLVGNLSMAGMLQNLGSSSNGWSRVGISLSSAMKGELDPGMQKVAQHLSTAVDLVAKVERSIDLTLSLTATATDTALADFTRSKQDAQEFKVTLNAQLRKMTTSLMSKVAVLVDQFMELLRPSLLQIQKWTRTFSEKTQSALEQFSGTLDQVQKLFDQVLSELDSGAGSNAEEMLFNTYRLFDADMSGVVYVDDLQDIARMYDVDALDGVKALEIFSKYDSNGRGGLDEQEFALMIQDPTIPGMMTVVLRSFANKLAAVSGDMGAARMRDEVASSLSRYLSIICTNNATVVEWVAQRLTDNSLPTPFTAVVLRNIALDFDNPSKATVADVGMLLVGHMMQMRPAVVVEVLRLLASSQYWESEAFPSDQQGSVVERVVGWVAATPNGPKAIHKGLGWDASSTAELPKVAAQVVKEAQATRSSEQRRSMTEQNKELYRSDASQVLRDQLLGGGSASGRNGGTAGPSKTKGQYATPATLEFARFLANNASASAEGYFQDCFTYSGQSSGALDSFAVQVNNVFVQTQQFLSLMKDFASPAGLDLLSSRVHNFSARAGNDLLLVSEAYVDSRLQQLACLQQEKDPAACAAALASVPEISNSLNFLLLTLGELKQVLPVVVQSLDLARGSVASVASGMKSIMTVLGQNAPPLFNLISSASRTIWVAYFCFFTLLTLGIGVYGFWATSRGKHSGRLIDHSYEAPSGWRDRLWCCCTACGTCFKSCNDNDLAFWSVLLLLQILVFVIFIVALATCIISGVQAFLSAGCSAVYILGDGTVCTGAMQTAKLFLDTFWSGQYSGTPRESVEETCYKQQLLTCDIIKREAGTSLLVTMIAGVLASVFTLQLVMESAILHEQARWQRVIDAEAKRP